MSTLTRDSAYEKIVTALKESSQGVTIADIVARSALPIEKVKELVPVASDEFGARLRVTESGEILYSFPNGFRSRYRGFGPAARRFFSAFAKGAAKVGKFLFKAWIAVMLVGYFVLFLAIALVALAASVAMSAAGNQDNRSDSRRGGGLGGLFLASRLFDLFIRIWFYSELTRSIDGDRYHSRDWRSGQRRRGRPLHQAVFSFVFGDGDPNADWEAREKKAVIAYIQANRGVISLPEFMVLTGSSPADAESAITAYLVEYGGSPEVSDQGTIVYRFDALLMRSEAATAPASAVSTKKPYVFSQNPKSMNAWFAGLNGFNLVFGGYFLISALAFGPIGQYSALPGIAYLYAIATLLFGGPAVAYPFIVGVLGIVPISFAALFYAVPWLRSRREAAANRAIERENRRKEVYRRIWQNPASVPAGDGDEGLVKELGAYSPPDVVVDDRGATVFRFAGLADEKKALAAYRAKVDPSASVIGKTVFDSHE